MHSVGGIVSAAHLKERGTRATLTASATRDWTRWKPVTRATAARPGPGSPRSPRRSACSEPAGATGMAKRTAKEATPCSAPRRCPRSGSRRWIGAAGARAERMTEEAAPLRDVAIIGGGCYGSFYAGQLEAACRKGRLTVRRVLVVDRDRHCRAARELAPPGREIVVAEWDALSPGVPRGRAAAAGEPDDAVVPSPLMPHLMAGWLLDTARNAGPAGTPGSPRRSYRSAPPTTRSVRTALATYSHRSAAGSSSESGSLRRGNHSANRNGSDSATRQNAAAV